jgi:two-component system, NtrC family, response regulator AtoC
MQSGLKIFIVEDDPWYGEFLEYHIRLNPSHEVHRFDNATDCIRQLGLKPDVITLDYRLPDMNGEEAVKEILTYQQDLKIIIISGQEDIGTAVQLLKNGAYDYITKDDDTRDRLWKVFNNIAASRALEIENEELKKKLSLTLHPIRDLVGDSQSMSQVRALVDKAANSRINVIVTGETGTGKELVARSIHYRSDRADKPFVTVNLSSLPEDIAERELFGVEKGTYADEPAGIRGKIEEANGGTLYINDLTRLSYNLQSKLLRVLQERTLTRKGGTLGIPIDVRVVISSLVDLGEEVAKESLREDLYYRLLGLSIYLPPLRDRGIDLMELARYFLNNYVTENGLPSKTLSPEAELKLKRYTFPGNVRELKAMIELAAVVSNGPVIADRDIIIHKVEKNNNGFLAEEKTLEEYNRIIIHHFLDKYNQKVLLVAERLGISKSTIYNLLKSQRNRKKSA